MHYLETPYFFSLLVPVFFFISLDLAYLGDECLLLRPQSLEGRDDLLLAQRFPLLASHAADVYPNT